LRKEPETDRIDKERMKERWNESYTHLTYNSHDCLHGNSFVCVCVFLFSLVCVAYTVKNNNLQVYHKVWISLFSKKYFSYLFYCFKQLRVKILKIKKTRKKNVSKLCDIPIVD